MPIKVVDASALVALLFGEPNGDRIGARLEGEGLAAPALLPFEVGNACLMKIRRHPDRRDALLAAFSLMARMEIEIVDVDPEAALALAEQTKLTVYDASYLLLARKLEAELITLDKRLDAAQAMTKSR
jgi:predicted nucleic acid-binding protein